MVLLVVQEGAYTRARENGAMRMLPVAAIVAAFAFGAYVSAQDAPAKPMYTPEAMLARIKQQGAPLTCGLPDKTRRPVNTTATFQGKLYRCVPMLNDELEWIGVRWTPEMPPRK